MIFADDIVICSDNSMWRKIKRGLPLQACCNFRFRSGNIWRRSQLRCLVQSDPRVSLGGCQSPVDRTLSVLFYVVVVVIFAYGKIADPLL